jgi:hypothetical protein
MRYWIGRLALTGLRRGFLEGSRVWFVVGVTAAAFRAARRLLADTPVTATLELRRGDAVEIRTIPPPPR